MTKIKKFEIWSTVGTIFIGSALHFAFGWSGESKPLALFAAVNESTWEHLKLAFWPSFIFMLTAYFLIGKKQNNFCVAQMWKLLLQPILIVVLFYGWLAFMPDNFFWDISIFMVAVVVAHIASYKIEMSTKQIGLKTLAFLVITLLVLSYSLFTYFPPRNFLFLDPVEGGYGIPK